MHPAAGMRYLWPDLRYALRLARRAPGFASIAVVCVALGIGVNTAVFSVFNALLLRPLPYRDADRLMAVYETNPARGWQRAPVCPADFLDWREQAQSFESVVAYQGWAPILTGVPQAERIGGLRASGALFELLGVEPLAGRAMNFQDEQQRARVVIVSHGLWQRVFGGDPQLVGRSVRLDGESYEVIGVMPREFQFPDREAEIWTPLNLESVRQQRGEHELQVVARLKPEADRNQARAELVAMMRRIDADFKNAGCSADAVPLREWYVGAATRRTLWLLLGAVSLVLLIACANVANLLLAHGSTRESELAVRVMLGATRTRLIAQRFTESLLLAFSGTVLGLGLAMWTRDALLDLLPARSIYRWVPTAIDWRVLAYTLALSIATAVVFGVLPAVRASRSDVMRSQTGGRVSATRLRTALLVVQAALAVTLLAGAGLLIRSFVLVWNVDPGFSTDQVLTARVNLPLRYREAEQPVFFDNLLARLRAIPGVKAAGAVTNIPLGGITNSNYITLEDRPAPPPEAIDRPGAERVLVSPGYFEAMQIPVHEGRLFTSADTSGAEQVVIVNREFARRYWPDGSPLGRRIKRGTPQAPFPWLTIVGVVANVKHGGLTASSAPTIYLHHQQTPSPGMTLVVRSDADTAAISARVRSAVREADPDLPVTAVRTLDDIVLGSRSVRWLPTVWVTVFSALALLLAGLGVYGVVSYAVARRAREFGIRLALGADRRDLVRLTLKQGIWPVAIGGVIGVMVAVNLTGILSGLLHGVGPTDPLTFAAAIGTLLVVGLIASYPPARRAAQQDPTLTLRQE
jgi:putative ABC transport system permease protein